MSDLARRLEQALAAGDREALVTLYQDAAAQTDSAQAQAFFLTHAYVHALEIGDAAAPTLKASLIALGCEAD